MKIKIIAVQVNTMPTAKGSYSLADVTYRNLSFGNKTESKKVMSFGVTKDTFGVMSSAQAGDVFEVQVVKNDKGYNDWVAATPSTEDVNATGQQGSAPGSATPVASTGSRGGYETPEERAKKQVYIIRQSSLSNAISTLAVGAKSAPSADAVIALAQRYTDYVLGNDVKGEINPEDLPPEVE